MKRTSSLFAGVLLGAMMFASVACDGGSSGTGITTAQGNVSGAQSALRRRKPTTGLARLLRWPWLEAVASAKTGLEDIVVRVEGSSLETRTDSEGFFVLRGDFAGPVGFLFSVPDGSTARLVVTVPRGGEVTLDDVVIDARSGEASADRQQVQFSGLVRAIHCAQNSTRVVSQRSPGDGNSYVVDLSNAAIHDSSGRSLTCAELSSGQSVEVVGEVGEDGEIAAEDFSVDESSPKGPPAG
jgi:hypothetical protein